MVANNAVKAPEVLQELILAAKKKFSVSDEKLSRMLETVGVQATGRAVAAWRGYERMPDHNAEMWIRQGLEKLIGE